MFTEGIYPIGDGLLDIDDEKFKALLVPHDINEIYDVEQTPFARGKFAAVRRAVHKNSGVHFAAKFLKRRRRAQSSDKEIKHEIAVLMLCDGADNIVKLNAVHESRSDTALLLELATGGELQTFLDNEECLNEAQARICMREVLKALQFLHKRSIAHLDLKPQNILLNSERIEDGLKLCDFGISRVVEEGTNVREIVGTPDYVAPEVLQYEPLSLLTDIWSVGVLTYVLLSGFSPFGGETKQETFLNISQCALSFPDKLFGGVSSAAIDFIRRALRIKPNDRMSALGCLEHAWLKDDCSLDRPIFGSSFCKTAANCEEQEDIEVEQADSGEETDSENDILDEERDSENDSEHGLLLLKSNGNHNGTHNGNAKIDNYDMQEEEMLKAVKPPTAATLKAKSAATKTTTTAVHTLPAATRATTIPLCNAQLQHVQMFNGARRHSSGSANKENKAQLQQPTTKSFLTTKKIMSSVNAAEAKKSMLPRLTTATIVIAGANGSTTTTTVPTAAANHKATSPQVSKLMLPRNSSTSSVAHDKCSAATNGVCLFPDAPTTPKVIRKAPTSDTSPTSVKALVKKFQHDGELAEMEAEQHNTSSCSSLPAGNGQLNGCSTASIRKSTSNATPTKNALKSNGSMLSNGRRCSEPLTAVHKTKLPMSPTTSYRSTCVLGLSCVGGQCSKSASLHAECRHSNALKHNGHATTTNSTAAATSPATASSSTNGNHSMTAAAILLQQHQQRSHHHVVTAANKSNTNNLSLDQGIIC